MAKGTISKKKKGPSIHSRAARRATSPSIDTDKTLKDVRPPAESIDHRPSILAIHHGAGVSKKTKTGRNASSKARRRHEKAQDRAAEFMEKNEKKVARSKGQARTIHSRRKAWDEINNQIPGNKKASTQDRNEEKDEEVSEFDDEMDEVQDKKEPAVTTGTDEVRPQPATDEDNDGIL
ncbi:Alb1-domain-containing protein [Xylariaceae sp. FL0662B]|nr:Alb1-domain-containing protein [Xylariaceae sp. FL0662B]